MKLKSPSLWLGVLTIGVVLYFVLADFTRTAPGPLSRVHGRESALQGFGSCDQCHGGWFHDMRESCLKCHDTVAQQLGRSEGLHGHLGNDRTANCAMCHGEHHGEDFAVTNQQSFALADVAEPQQFDHGIVGFDMGGRHLQLACTSCHLHADTPLLPLGQQRYLGLQSDCAGCHVDAHQGRMRMGCAECHGQDSFGLLAPTHHDKVLPLLGGHGGLSCDACHQDGTDHSLDAIGQRPQAPARQCQDCHESPHAQPFVVANSKLLALPPRQGCVGCHRPEHDSFRDDRLQLTAAQHQGSGFALAPPHDQQRCSDCHAPEFQFALRYPGRDADTCGSCHEDVHRGQFDASPVGERGCLGCHNRLHFAPPAFGVLQHERTAFPLTGRHQDTDCRRCHVRPDAAAPRRFHGTRSHCADCHQDVHAGRFVTAMPGSSAPAASSCAECHDPRGFERLPPGGFDHARWTGFGLAGKHAKADCEACHPALPEPDRAGRTWTAAKGTTCASCHQDHHLGQFEVAGRTDCQRCHKTAERFADLSFRHDLDSRFPLGEPHDQLACSACHKPVRIGAIDTVRYRPIPYQCTDCHGAQSDPLHRPRVRRQ